MVSDQHAEPNTRLMRSKKTILVSTFNVRTIREECRQEELVSCMIKQGIDIIGIQEHREVHNDYQGAWAITGYIISLEK